MNLFMTNNQLIYLRSCVLRAARVHFFLVATLSVSILIFDGWNYITLENALRRWTVTGVLFVVTTVVWYASRSNSKSVGYYKGLMLGLILADILTAALFVYNDRAVASPAVALFAIPVVTAAILYSRRAVFAVAALCTAAYSLTCIRYFVVHFNEAISVQLYGTIILYCTLFFVLAALLWIVLTPYHPTD